MNGPDGSPASFHQRFDDPARYQSAIRGSGRLFSVLQRGTFQAELTSVEARRVTLQRGREVLPRVGSSGLAADRTGLLGWFSDTPLPVVRGTQVCRGDWLFLGPGMESHHRSFGMTDFVALTMQARDLTQAAAELIGHGLDIAPGTVIRPPAALGDWLLSVIDAATRVAQTKPMVFSAPLAAAALEQALLRPMILCCVHGETRAESISRRRRVALAKRFEAAVEANIERPMLMPELCRIVGVPERTLRTICKEQLSVSPQQYLTLRRLHMTREALLAADQHSTTVTGIATAYGFWELGRFAGTYKSLFGESPSVTLRRQTTADRQ